MLNYKVKDIKLAKQGKLKLDWAEDHMPVLMKIREEFKKTKPFKNMRIATCLHITKESGVLVRTLAAGGAELSLAACNPLSTQDDIAAALADEGHHVYGWRGINNEEYYENINHALDLKPDITIDDANDLLFTIHTKRTELLKDVKGGCEETTSGVLRLQAMEREGVLKYPVIAVNDAKTKHLFDNRYGTGQSAFDGILRATNVLVAGSVVVIVGYGWCGRGLAARAKGMGGIVIVTEVDPVAALEARMDGFQVMSMTEASKLGDIFVTATGNKHAINGSHIKLLKDGAILANAGHFNIEIDSVSLEKIAKKKREMRPNCMEYTLPNGNKVYLLAEGRLINLSSAEGHPSEVMDMSFSTQALSAEYISKNYKSFEPKVYNTLPEQDSRIAALKLESMGVKIDSLTAEQKKYLASWDEGTS
jgi:adenosylhomocysteinase